MLIALSSLDAVLLSTLVGLRFTVIRFIASTNNLCVARPSWPTPNTASLPAEAEITAPKGVAPANRITGDSRNETYLRYLWIDWLEVTKDQMIYMQTKTELPLPEASYAVPQP
jgi:hypothetical protein